MSPIHPDKSVDSRTTTERQQAHIEQLKSEMIEDHKEIEDWRKKFLIFGSTAQEAATAIARRITDMDEEKIALVATLGNVRSAFQKYQLETTENIQELINAAEDRLTRPAIRVGDSLNQRRRLENAVKAAKHTFVILK